MLMRHVHPKLQFTHMLPYGAILHENGVQFVVFSRSATAMRVLLYDKASDTEPEEVIEFQRDTDRWGDIWSIFVPGLGAGALYHFQAEGPHDPATGQWFNSQARLIDPYAKALAGDFQPSTDGIVRPPKCVVVDDYFDWEGDRHVRRDVSETVIYETHVRGFTQGQDGEGQTPGDVPRPDRKDSVPEVARNHRRRTDAGPRVSDQRHLWREARTAELLGLRSAGVLLAASRLLGGQGTRLAGHRVQADGQGAARCGNRGDSRRRVQSHLRRERTGTGAVASRDSRIASTTCWTMAAAIT